MLFQFTVSIVFIRLSLVLLLSLSAAGCLTNSGSTFNIKKLAKSDIDIVTDNTRKELLNITRQLTIKLYKRNPRELKKTPGITLDQRLKQIFEPTQANDPKRKPKYRETLMSLAFMKDFKGDRVFNLMRGMYLMLDAAYSHKQEFFLTDKLDKQKLYNSARNLEIIAWNLNSRKYPDNSPLILSNSLSEQEIINLSFERNFGKMIALQDMLAFIISGGDERIFKNAVQKVASLTFLPI